MFSKGDMASTAPIYPLWIRQHLRLSETCTISSKISCALPIYQLSEAAHNILLWRHMACECEYALRTLAKTFTVHSNEHWVKSKNKLWPHCALSEWSFSCVAVHFNLHFILFLYNDT